MFEPVRWKWFGAAFLGRSEEAIALMTGALEATPWHSILRGYAGAVFGLAGATEDARAILRSFGAIKRDGGYVDPFNLALVHMGLSEHDEALTQLERCANEGSMQNWIIAPEPLFDPLRDEPRFRDVLGRLDLPAWAPPARNPRVSEATWPCERRAFDAAKVHAVADGMDARVIRIGGRDR